MRHNILKATSIFLLFFQYVSAFSQTAQSLQVISPYDSIQVSDIKANGNSSTGEVSIVITVVNHYHKLSDLQFSLGGFSDFGVTDDKGNKYKVFTDDRQVGTNGINGGYLPITSVQFGKSKMGVVTFVKDTLHTDQSKELVIRLKKVNKDVETLTNLNIRCILTLNYMWVGDKIFQIKGAEINWVRGTAAK